MAALRLWWARWLPASPNGRIARRLPPSRDSTPCTGHQHEHDRVSACVARSELCICPYGCSTEATGGSAGREGGNAREPRIRPGGGRPPRARRRGKQPCQTRENENAVPDTEPGTRDIHTCVDGGYGQWRGGRSGRWRRSRRWRRGARAPSQQRRAVRRVWQVGAPRARSAASTGCRADDCDGCSSALGYCEY
jgi:hypothetical protein